MRRLVAFFRPEPVEQPVELVEEPVIVEKDYDMSLDNWRVLWSGWPICPKCQATLLARSGKNEWPVPRHSLHDPLPTGGEKCNECNERAPLALFTVSSEFLPEMTVEATGYEQAASLFSHATKFEGDVKVVGELFTIIFDVMFMDSDTLELELDRKITWFEIPAETG